MISKLDNKSLCLKIWLFGPRTQTVFSIIVSWLLAGAVMQAGDPFDDYQLVMACVCPRCTSIPRIFIFVLSVLYPHVSPYIFMYPYVGYNMSNMSFILMFPMQATRQHISEWIGMTCFGCWTVGHRNCSCMYFRRHNMMTGGFGSLHEAKAARGLNGSGVVSQSSGAVELFC